MFSETTTLAVPAEYAFAFLADPSTAPVIDPAVREYTPDSLPLRVGTRNLIRFRMWGVPVRAVSVVREWEPGRRMVMENVQPSWPVRAVATHTFVLGALGGRIFARFMHSNAKGQQRRFALAVQQRFAADSATEHPTDG